MIQQTTDRVLRGGVEYRRTQLAGETTLPKLDEEERNLIYAILAFVATIIFLLGGITFYFKTVEEPRRIAYRSAQIKDCELYGGTFTYNVDTGHTSTFKGRHRKIYSHACVSPDGSILYWDNNL